MTIIASGWTHVLPNEQAECEMIRKTFKEKEYQMKSISVSAGQEIIPSNTHKSLDERIAEGEKELADTLNAQQILMRKFLYAKLDSEEERISSAIDYSYFKEKLLIKQLFVLNGMRDGNIVHKLPKYSRKTHKGLGRAWSTDLVFDYLLEYNHREFKARGGWEAYNEEASFHDDRLDAYRLELFVLLDF